jgi:hypothetical protein
MHASEPIGVSECLRTSHRPGCDYVDGLVIGRNLLERKMGECKPPEPKIGEWDRANLQRASTAFLRAWRKAWNMQAVPECRMRVATPFICTEALSSEDRMSRVQERVDDHIAFGVPYVWIVDPRTRKGHNCTPQALTETAVLRTENPGIVVTWDAVFEF